MLSAVWKCKTNQLIKVTASQWIQCQVATRVMSTHSDNDQENTNLPVYGNPVCLACAKHVHVHTHTHTSRILTLIMHNVHYCSHFCSGHKRNLLCTHCIFQLFATLSVRFRTQTAMGYGNVCKYYTHRQLCCAAVDQSAFVPSRN